MYLEMGGKYNNEYFKRKIFVNNIQIKKIRNEFNNTDVYSTLFLYEDDKSQDESNLIGPLYIDLDADIKNEDDYKLLKKDLNLILIHLENDYGINKKYIKFYFSGKKGFHLIIPYQIFNIKPCKELNTYYKLIANDLNNYTLNKIVDTRIYDNKRLIRLPNSINSKSGLYKVPISYNDIINLSFEEIKQYATKPHSVQVEKPIAILKALNKYNEIITYYNNKNKKHKKNKQFNIPKNVDIHSVTFPSCINNLIANGCEKGNRNNSTIILCSGMLQKGISYDDCLEIITEWNETKIEPSLPNNELIATLNSAYTQILNGRRYGCTSIKDLGLCNKSCKIFK